MPNLRTLQLSSRCPLMHETKNWASEHLCKILKVQAETPRKYVVEVGAVSNLLSLPWSVVDLGQWAQFREAVVEINKAAGLVVPVDYSAVELEGTWFEGI
ncbi:hypothetical protein EJ08DRAFT_654354 [Tothia fuscella]|uniref:Uncharacterized protein n=1 Tax=Tothia fuscella TaxID=1048955 RepID=A0A9P4NFA3_9PEZI|nr:hypothetical protein EJ08DRAFT_654354 [Tothia fuscella]